MENIIERVCRLESLQDGDITRHHAFARARKVKVMLLYYLVRDRRVAHRKVAARFGCSRVNVLRTVRTFGESMVYQPGIRKEYLDFIKKVEDVSPTFNL